MPILIGPLVVRSVSPTEKWLLLNLRVDPITVTLCHIQAISKFSIRIRLTGPLKETNEPYEMATLKYILNCFFLRSLL